MSAFTVDDTRETATITVELTAEQITYGISDAMIVPYLARLSGRVIRSLLSSEVKTRSHGSVVYTFPC